MRSGLAKAGPKDHMDAKPILAELRAALGPLVEPFEDAALGRRSYSDVGRANGEDM